MPPPPANLYCQLTADDASLTKTGNEVTAWAVKSGAIGAASFTRSGTTGPSHTTSGQNYVQGTGATPPIGLRAMEQTSTFAIGAQPTTIGFRCWFDSGDRQALVDGIGGQRNLIEFNVSVTSWAYFSGTYRSGSLDIVTGQWLSVIGVFNGASSLLWVNGTDVTTANPGTLALTAGTRIMANNSSGVPFGGRLSEILWYTAALSGSTLTDLKNYLLAGGFTASTGHYFHHITPSGLLLGSGIQSREKLNMLAV